MNDDARYKVRSAPVTGTAARTSFRFDESTWAAIDMVAAKANLSWVDWAARAIEARPNAGSKAGAVRSALADALLEEQYAALVTEGGPGVQSINHIHGIVGEGYYRLNDETLAIEVDGADIAIQDDAFEGFTLIVGYRAKAAGGAPFVCVKNRLRDGLHLFIAQE